MKQVISLAAILLISLCGFSQTLTGLWSGTFSNDSTTLRADQPFEIALTDYRGVVKGYSRREFIKNDTLYYVLKRVKGRVTGDSCEVTEDEFISYNFPAVDKGVQITYTFRLGKNDSIWKLDGRWKTNRVLKRRYGFWALTGNVQMSGEKDLSKSKLFPHLQELKLAEDVPFYVQAKKQEKLEQDQRDAVVAAQKKVQTPVPVTGTGITGTRQAAPPGKETQSTATSKLPEKKAPGKEKPKDTPKAAPDSTQLNKDLAKIPVSTEAKKVIPPVKNDSANVSLVSPATKAEPATRPPAANVEKRKIELQQSVDFVNDSLSIALFDNGEIDGDTVSVLVNGEIILANQGLKASAIRKTIYITPAMKDSFTLVLYAENLGKYPPNTGLMIVHDGDEVYQIRFSADLQKNVAVIFKRKKK